MATKFIEIPEEEYQREAGKFIEISEEDFNKPGVDIGTSFSQEVAQLGPAFMESLGRPLENMGEGFEVVGYQGVANALKGAVTEPENYVSAAQRFMEPEPGESQFLGFAWQYAPRAAVEQAGQAVGSMASRFVGAAAGAPLGPAGIAAGAFVGPAIFGAAQVIGPVAKERARNNGREVPNNQDLAAATLTAIGSGALDAIGARYLPGGDKATGKFFKRVASSFVGEGLLTEVPQSGLEQVGGTLGTEAGLKINAKQMLGEGFIAGTSAAGLTGVTYPFTKDPKTQTIRTPEQAKEIDIDGKSTAEAVELMGQPGDDQNAELRTTIQEAEREIANNETLINALEPNDPERTRLELQNAEAKKIAARMRGRLEETVGLTPVESEQARLAREIAAPPAEPAAVTPAPATEAVAPTAEAPTVTPSPVSETITPAQEAAPATTPATVEAAQKVEEPLLRVSLKQFDKKIGNFLKKEYPELEIGDDKVVATMLRYRSKVSRAEKASDPSNWTQQERDAYESGDYEKFSRLRGYSQSEINDFKIYQDYYNTLRNKYGQGVMNELDQPTIDRFAFDTLYGKGEYDKNQERILDFERPDISPPMATPEEIEPAGIAIGNRVKTKTTPQSFVVEEVLPQSEREAELGEQYYRIKNERTGEVQTVEANDITAIKKQPKRKGEAGGVIIPSRQDWLDFAENIYEAGMSFADWSKKMLTKFGEAVRSALQQIWDQVGGFTLVGGRRLQQGRERGAVTFGRGEEPTGPAPESPEGQSVPQALGNGIDIGPENNMPINRKIDSHIKNFLFLRGFFESASDRLRRNGFVKLGDAIKMYFDQAQRRLGDANKIMLPAMEAYKAVPADRKKQIEQDFETFFAAQENGRDTDAIRKQMDPIARRIVDSWQRFGEESGKENQRVGVKVYDPKIKGWRKIGQIPKFWPRRMKPEYQRALYDPDKYPKEYNEIIEALLEDGKIKDAREAEMYLREYDPEATRNDYFSGIEKARGNPLPEKLYDYSMQVMPDYIARWAQHVSRIEQFGQKTTEESQTLWERERKSTRDQRTIDYIKAAQDRVEGYFPNSPWLKGTATLNIWATGLQLGNPASAFLNLIGGSTLNAMIGQPGALGSYVESLVELRNLGVNINDAKEKGIIGRDLMNIVGDHQAILETNKVYQAGQKLSDILLKWSGFTPAEQMIRTQSLIIGKSFVRKTLEAYLKNPKGSFARRANAFLTRNGFDLDRILVEQGTGPETDRLLRYFANISQGSYTIDQVPLFIDMPEGRFLLKYQKFSTQVMRMSWKNTFEPLFKAMTGKGEEIQIPDKTRQLIYRLLQAEAKELGDNRRVDMASVPKTATKAQARALALIPAMMWLGAAYVGGEVLLRMRDMLFGVLMKGPEYEDMLKELEDDEKASAMYLAMERAWYNLIGIGALGLIGNYAQFFQDWQDRERVKNPLEPPALGVAKDTFQLVTNAVDQGTVTAGDIDNFTRSTVSAYRATKKLAESTAGFLGLEDIPGVKQEMFRREVANINKYARRWANESGIEYRMRRPTDITASPRTPVNRKIASYMQTGEPVAAATYAKAYIKGLPKDERDNARQSILTGARNRQPLRLGSGPMDEAERKAFLTWLKDKVNEKRFKEISELDAKYQKDYKTFLSEMKRP